MADQSTTSPPPPDQTLPQILAALQSIAAAVTRGTDLIVDAADERPVSQEQSTTIVDYLVLRELVGRQFDQVRRTVAATRFTGQQVEFDGAIPSDAVKVAVFTRRSVAPDEVAEIDRSFVVDVRRRQGARRGSGGGDTVPGFDLSVVTDDQPIVRLELRDAADLAVALGPRLAPVT